MDRDRQRRLVILLPAIGGALTIALLLTVMLLFAALIGGATTASSSCEPTATPIPAAGAPVGLQAIFTAAAARFDLGPSGPSILAGLTSVESGFGQNMGPSSAGAIGWTQFMPATWAQWGIDANGDGKRDPYTASDAIFSTARYLHASGAPQDWYRALFAYNHADSYVTEVLARAKHLAVPNQAITGAAPTATPQCDAVPGSRVTGVKTITATAGLAEVPGFPGMRVDRRILPDVVYLVRTYHLTITAAYATRGHAADGEHPLGLAVDLVPGPGGNWDDVDRLAHWAEPVQNAPRPPFRWVGYDGDPNHGRGNHLHLSWNHAPDPARQPPARWVQVMKLGGPAL